MTKEITITRWNKAVESHPVDEVKRVIVNPSNKKAWVILYDDSTGNIELDVAAELATLGIETKESALVNWLNGKLTEV